MAKVNNLQPKLRATLCNLKRHSLLTYQDVKLLMRRSHISFGKGFFCLYISFSLKNS